LSYYLYSFKLIAIKHLHGHGSPVATNVVFVVVIRFSKC